MEHEFLLSGAVHPIWDVYTNSCSGRSAHSSAAVAEVKVTAVASCSPMLILQQGPHKHHAAPSAAHAHRARGVHLSAWLIVTVVLLAICSQPICHYTGLDMVGALAQTHERFRSKMDDRSGCTVYNVRLAQMLVVFNLSISLKSSS